MKNEYFDFNISKVNESFAEMSDMDLVRMAQKDIDRFRHRCVWRCLSCKNQILYSDSLQSKMEFYIHEIKCKNKIDTKRKNSNKTCNGKMELVNTKNLKCDSIYFNELFHRYQRRLVHESMSCYSIDYPDEVYSILVTCFLKIVSQFARDKKLTIRSEKWFSSFFWQSIQNKIADIKKTNNYAKRCPPIKCKCCGSMVGQITQQHLRKNGHEKIFEAIYLEYGKVHMNKNSEMSSRVFDKKAIELGKSIIKSLTEAKQKKIINDNLIPTYLSLFPGANTRNKIISMNEKTSQDSNSEMGDMLCEEEKVDTIVEGINLYDKIKQMSIYIVDDYHEEISSYFSNNKSRADMIDNVYNVISKKVVEFDFYSDVNCENEINIFSDEEQDRFVETIFDLIKKSKKCLMLLDRSDYSPSVVSS